MRRLLVALGLVLLLVPPVASAQSTTEMARELHDQIVSGGPWRFHSVPCVDGIVTQVNPRLVSLGQKVYSAKDFAASGVEVLFKVPPTFHFMPNMAIGQPVVVHYQGDSDNGVMQAQRAGDKVQVCLMGFPTPTYDTTSARYVCNPDRDPRGFIFRIYSYRQHAAYYGPSSEHDCGGA